MLRSTLGSLRAHAMRAAGATITDAAAQARTLLFGYVSKRAFVDAVADCFLMAGLVTLIGVVPVLALRGRRRDEAQTLPPAGGPAE